MRSFHLYIFNIHIYRGEINVLMSRNKRDINMLQNKILGLEHDLALKDSELEQEKHIKEDLLNQSFAVAQSQDSERKLLILISKINKA